MIFLRLAIKSLRNRSFSTTLTVISICLSMTLLLCVERAKRASEEGFTQTISRTDLIVGARSGPLQLILYSVFNMGNATHNISYKTFQEIQKNPKVQWTIPYSLGDGHRGFRVVGTNLDFFKYYRFRGYQKIELSAGKEFSDVFDVVLGAEVARKFNYKVGSRIVVSHGVTKTEGVLHHDDKPFIVSGILKPTGTALDRSLYVSLEGIEAMHLDWHEGADRKKEIEIEDVTAVFVGAKSRSETLRLQREINEYKAEPLLAIIPGVVLAELWQGLSYVEGVLRAISWMVVIIGFLGMLIALTTTLNERRREMAILRAVGAKSFQIVGLLVFESALLTILGIVLGVIFSFLVMALLGPWAEQEFGLSLAGSWMTNKEFIYIGITFVGGTLIGFIPALRAQSLALKDGLSIRI